MIKEVLLNYLVVARYCKQFPHPWWKYGYVCWRVYQWRRDIGIITPMKLTGFFSYWLNLFKGINSYGYWLRNGE